MPIDLSTRTSDLEKESDALEQRSSPRTVGGFLSSGQVDLTKYLGPKPLPPPPYAAPLRSITDTYLQRANDGLSSFAAPRPPAAPIVPKPLVIANSASEERDANFAKFGTNFPTPAQVTAATQLEEGNPLALRDPTAGAVYKRRLERNTSVNYNPSSTL